MPEKPVQQKSYLRTCDQCREPFTSHRAHSAYCSGACRAKASRKAHGAIVGNPSAASARRNATKAAQRHERTCRQCGQPFAVNGKQGRRLYCGDRCKKRAYNVAHGLVAGAKRDVQPEGSMLSGLPTQEDHPHAA